MNARPVPLDFFGMTSGLVGLVGTRLTVSDFGRAPTAIGDIVRTTSARHSRAPTLPPAPVAFAAQDNREAAHVSA